MNQRNPRQQQDCPEEKKRKGILSWLYETQVWKSIFRHGYPDDQKNRVLAILGNTFLHLHPAKVKKSGIKLEYTWCMGGLTFFLFLLETVTGIMLMFYYRPTTAHAYNDILALREHVPLGFLRELHRWGAHGMVISVWLHMFRVFMTGSYKPPREFNWCVGVVLLVLTLFMSFTGYLLPWDQIAIWAITVGTRMGAASPFVGNQGPFAPALQIGDVPLVTQTSDVSFVLLGSRSVSGSTLLRFYVFHCVAVPLILAFLIAVHFWRVRKDGGISAPL